MRFKGTLVLLFLVAGMGAWLYFYEYKGKEERDKAKEAEKRVWSIEDKYIDEIELHTPEGRTAARRVDKGWQLIWPGTWDADAAELDRIVQTAAALTHEEVIETEGADLHRFGLKPPASGIKLKTRDGRQLGLDFGSTNPTGSYTYAARSGEMKVFLLPTDTTASFNRKPEDLRDRTILHFNQAEARELDLRTPKGRLELVKDGDDRWWFKGMNKRAANGPAVRGILNALSYDKIGAFAPLGVDDYENPGLNGSFIEARLVVGAEKAAKRIVVGSEKSRLRARKSSPAAEDKSSGDTSATELFLARDDSRPDPFFVDKVFVDKLLLDPGDVRDKALASFQRWDVDTILLWNTKGFLQFSKSGGQWYLGKERAKVQWNALNALLDAVEKPVIEWIDRPGAPASYGLDNPKIRIVLKKGGTVLADCALGASAAAGIYARTAGDPSVRIADAEGLEWLDRAAADYMEPRVPEKTE